MHGQPHPRPSRVAAHGGGDAPARDLHARDRARPVGRTVWDDDGGRRASAGGSAAEPVQARDLFDLSAAMWDAWAAYDPKASGYFAPRSSSLRRAGSRETPRSATPPTGCCSGERRSTRTSSRTFALLTERLRSLCFSPDFTSTAGGSPAALGNRIAAAAIAAGRNDGSNEALHYADPTYMPLNAPCSS